MANPLASVSIVGRRPEVAILGVVEFPLCVAVAAGEAPRMRSISLAPRLWYSASFLSLSALITFLARYPTNHFRAASPSPSIGSISMKLLGSVRGREWNVEGVGLAIEP